MSLKRIYLNRLGEKTTKTIAQWQKMYRGKKVHAVAGIAQPHHFFATLEQAGLVVERHIFANHHGFTQQDFAFAGDAPIHPHRKGCSEMRRFYRSRSLGVVP